MRPPAGPALRSRLVATVLAAVLAPALGAGLTGCAGAASAGSGLPTFTATGPPTTSLPPGRSATRTPAPTASAPAGLPTLTGGPNRGLPTGVALVSSTAGSTREKAAVEAFLAYWQYLSTVGAELRIDDADLARVARGGAADDLQAYLQDLRDRGARTVGWAGLHVTEVRVGANAVLISGCVDNGSFDVKATTGERLERGAVAFDTEGAVRRLGGALRVTSWDATDRSTPCPKESP